MALAHAILATLIEEPLTGYDLAKRFGADGYFWRASHQQIYRELARLEADGAVAPVNGPAGARGDRPRAITSHGRTILAEWGGRPSDPATIKEDVLVKCMALELIDPADLARQIVDRRATQEARGRQHSDLLAARFPDGAPSAGAPLGLYLTLQGGVDYERAWVEWADLALALLSRSAAAGEPASFKTRPRSGQGTTKSA